MEEFDVMFAGGAEALGGARSCRVKRFVSESSAVLLASLESSCPPLLLGCVRRVFPGTSFAVTEEERKALGLSPEGDDGEVEVFCRVIIPASDPLSAGFDLSRLVLVVPSRGTALEAARPGAPVIPLKSVGGNAGR